jgi:predicted phage terminase large subunit-like protein
MSNRLNDMEKSAIAVIMQRVHEDDVSGALIELGDYDHLMIPMEWDGRRYHTSIDWTDPRSEDGQLAWSERFSRRVVEGFKTTLGPYGYAGQYQQAPTPRGGGIFKREWWQLWGNPDDPDDPQFKKFPACEYIIGSLDTAYTQKTENDFSAMTVWGVYYDRYDMPKAILMNAWRDRLALHDLVERTAATSRRFKIDRLLIESKAAGISVSQELQRLHAAEGYGLQLVDPKGGDKTARAYAIQHLFAAEMIYAPDRDWADMVITEMSSFPRAPHDDLVDSVTQALKHLRDAGLLIHGSEMAAEMEGDLMGPVNSKPLYPV